MNTPVAMSPIPACDAMPACTMRQDRLTLFRRRGAIASAILLSLVAGCGSTDDGESSEADRVSALVSEVGDAAARPDAFRALFVEGSAPDDAQRQQYRDYMYLATNVDIEGAEATIEVLVEDAGDNVVGTVTWTARRQDNTWKLDTVALPRR
jgi:hypothetical protein